MKHSKRHIWALAVTMTLATLGTVGCFSYQGPSQADYSKVENDPNLSETEKEQKVEELAGSANFYAPNYYILGSLVAVGIALCMGTLAVRRRIENGPTASRDRFASRPAPRSGSKSTGSTTAPPPTLKQQARQTEDSAAPKLPANQREVDALAFEERGTSFFTARPAPANMLVKADIETGIWIHSVVCTEEEARQIARGQIPLIRAFTVDKKTVPWYEWTDFNPYTHYWDAIDGDWRVGGVRAIACWLSLDTCNPELKGYYSGADKDEEDAAPHKAHATRQ